MCREGVYVQGRVCLCDREGVLMCREGVSMCRRGYAF